MVDLAKIRKKAKKAAAELLGSEQPPAEQAAPAPASPAPASPAPASPVPAEPPQAVAVATPAAAAVSPAAADPNAPTKLEAFKLTAGKRRAAEAAKVEAQEGASLELLTFVIAGEQYAVDIERIVEIVTPRPVTRIPNADAAIVGIISLRGTIVTLVDVRRKLRHQPLAAANADTRIVVIDFNNEMVGFVVDRVLRVVKIGAGDVEPHPVVHTTELDEAIRGVFRVAGALSILLDLDKLLDRALEVTRRHA